MQVGYTNQTQTRERTHKRTYSPLKALSPHPVSHTLTHSYTPNPSTNSPIARQTFSQILIQRQQLNDDEF